MTLVSFLVGETRKFLLLFCFGVGDFSVLCSYLTPRGERWMSGDFLAVDRIIMWSDAGKGYMYKLPAK